MESHRFKAELCHLYEMLSFVKKYSKDPNVELAVEEVVVNSIKHGKSDWIEISCKKIEGGVEVVLRDNGIPYDPTIPRPEVEGRGLCLLLGLIAKITYVNERGSNRLTLTQIS